jgi:hypothetical protein
MVATFLGATGTSTPWWLIGAYSCPGHPLFWLLHPAILEAPVLSQAQRRSPFLWLCLVRLCPPDLSLLCNQTAFLLMALKTTYRLKTLNRCYNMFSLWFREIHSRSYMHVSCWEYKDKMLGKSHCDWSASPLDLQSSFTMEKIFPGELASWSLFLLSLITMGFKN